MTDKPIVKDVKKDAFMAEIAELPVRKRIIAAGKAAKQ